VQIIVTKVTRLEFSNTIHKLYKIIIIAAKNRSLPLTLTVALTTGAACDY